eukprot:COSAG05_NODE_487_length_9342_cov_4.078979_9_plen_83_part_00
MALVSRHTDVESSSEEGEISSDDDDSSSSSELSSPKRGIWVGWLSRPRGAPDTPAAASRPPPSLISVAAGSELQPAVRSVCR